MKCLPKSDKQDVDMRLVQWKVIRAKGIRGEDIELPIPDVIDNAYRRTLIARILSMEKKNPLTFKKAIRLADEKSREAAFDGRLGVDPGQSYWYWSHFVEWISSQGYHIELTGDEFDPVSAVPLRDC